VSTWEKVYSFPKEGEGMAARTNKFASGKFCNPINPKNGFRVADCKNFQYRRVLEFLVSILNPERSTRITVMFADTIFGALSRDRKVFMGVVIKDVVMTDEDDFRGWEVKTICSHSFSFPPL